MRFLYIKNMQTCYHCGGDMYYGEEAVVVRIRHANGVFLPQFFHTDQCFENWSSETFTRRLIDWRMSATERPKRKRISKKKVKPGRPRKYSKPMVARKFIASIFYHKKQGHDTTELESKLKELEI